MDRFDEMETFIRVVEAGSITRAADQLSVAKSAVSRRLSDLEARLGTQLLRRTTRRLSLTDTGRAYYDQSVRLLNDLTEVEASVSEQQKELAGPLRVTAPLSFGLQHMIDAIDDFLHAHPSIDMSLDFSDRHINLIEDNVDVAIRIGDLTDSQLIACKLFPVKSIACASPDYLAQHGVPQTPDDLLSHNALLYSLRMSPDFTYLGPDQEKGVLSLKGKHSANNANLLCELAVAGHGFVIMPVFHLCEALSERKLVPFLTTYSWGDINAYAVYPSKRHLSHRVRTFIDFLDRYYKDYRPWETCIDQYVTS